MKWYLYFFTIVACMVVSAQTPEQILRYRNDGKGSIINRKKGVLDGNNVRTVFQNNGEIADWYDGAVRAPHLEWPKGTGHRHLDGFTFMVGAKVKITTPLGQVNQITPIETSYREEMDYDPVTAERWGFEPIAGYANPSGATPAMSNDKNSYPGTWPAALGLGADWNGEWYGAFGKGQRSGVLETYYVMDDSKDKEFQSAAYGFYPVDSDSTRGGLGLRVEVRGIASTSPLVSDDLFWNYTVTNISDRHYDTTAFGLFFDPAVGSVSNDARVQIPLNLVYAWAPYGKGLPDNYSTGYVGFTVFPDRTSPNPKNVATMYLNMLGSKGPTSVWPKNDGVMWNAMTSGFKDTLIANANISVVIGSNIFSFPKWTSESFDVGMILGNDLPSIIGKKTTAQLYHDNHFQLPESVSVFGTLDIDAPLMHQTVSGDVTVSWNVHNALGKYTSHVFISDGISTTLIGSVNSGVNSILWKSSSAPDGIFYTTAVWTVSDDGAVLYKEQSFTLNNPAAARPEVRIVQPAAGASVKDTAVITWYGGDADGDAAVVNLYYKRRSDPVWTPIVSHHNAAGSFAWDTKGVPNSSSNDYLLKAEIVSQTDTSFFITSGFSVLNTGNILQGDPFIVFRKSKGTGTLGLNVVDPHSITGHQYLVTFVPKADKTMTASVKDLQTGITRLTGIAPLDGSHESATFDGIRLVIGNDTTVAIDNTSGLLPGFTTNAVFASRRDYFNPVFSVAWPADYRIQFSKKKEDISVIEDLPMFIKDSVNFTITNITDGYRCKFLIEDVNSNGSYNAGDSIHILDGYVNAGSFKMCYTFAYGFGPGTIPVPPSDGDVYLLKTKRPFVAGDSIVFTSVGLSGIRKNNDALPSSFSLSQNFPNPFNPATTIRFSIPSGDFVDLKVYDVMGRVVAVLVRERLKAGEYDVTFDGTRLSSGTYFMRLNVGNRAASKKLMLVK